MENNKNKFHQGETLDFNGKTYQPMNKEKYEQCYDAFDIIHHINKGEYAQYSDKYIIKNDDKFYAVYIDDLTNFWEI